MAFTVCLSGLQLLQDYQIYNNGQQHCILVWPGTVTIMAFTFTASLYCLLLLQDDLKYNNGLHCILVWPGAVKR